MPNTGIGGELTNDRSCIIPLWTRVWDVWEEGERFSKFDTTQHQTAERDIEYQDISQQEIFLNQIRSDFTIIIIFQLIFLGALQ